MEYAYLDEPLPLMPGKTISQPTTVMMMTAALQLVDGDKVFEVGCGSGYHAAIIGHIIGATGQIITTEVTPELIPKARESLTKAGIQNSTVIEMDGSNGAPDHAPFDKILITSKSPPSKPETCFIKGKWAPIDLPL